MIRKYHEKDTEDILDTWYQSSLVAHPFLEADFLTSERENIRNIYLPNTETWVYEGQGKVVGFIAMMGNEVGAIFVQPFCQGKGIGSQLMDLVAKLHETLEVEVFEKNIIGRAFYKKYGYVFMHESIHKETGFNLFRLMFDPRL